MSAPPSLQSERQMRPFVISVLLSLTAALGACSESEEPSPQAGSDTDTPETTENSPETTGNAQETTGGPSETTGTEGGSETTEDEDTFGDGTVSLHDIEVSTMAFEGLGPFTQPDPSNPPDLAVLYDTVFEMDSEARRVEVVEYFRTRFGADVEAPENMGRIELVPFEVAAELNYQIEEINAFPLAQPMRVHDFGWVLFVLDPEGFELGGEFAGQLAPAGATASAGDYGIDNGEEVVRISFHGTRPFIYTKTGGIDFECALESDVVGTGLGRGLQEFQLLDGGDLELRISGLATFDSE